MHGVDRLNHYLSGADSAPIHEQAQHWHTMAVQLREIATNLKSQGDQLPDLLGAQTGPAAQQAFHAAAASLQARAEQFHQGHVAYKMAGDAIDDANSGRSSLPAEAPSAGPAPRSTTSTPDTAQIQQQIHWSQRQAQYQQSITTRDNRSDTLANHVDQQYAQATAIMRGIHGIDASKSTGSTGSTGGGGAPAVGGPSESPAYVGGPTGVGPVSGGGAPYSPAPVLQPSPAPVSPVSAPPPSGHPNPGPGGTTTPVSPIPDPHAPNWHVPGPVSPVAGGGPGGPNLSGIVTGVGTAGGAVGAGFLGLRGLGGKGGVPGVPGAEPAQAEEPGMRGPGAIPGEPEAGVPGSSVATGSAAASEADAEAAAMGGRGAGAAGAAGRGGVPLGGGAGGRGSDRKGRRGSRDMWDDGSDWIDDEASGTDVVR